MSREEISAREADADRIAQLEQEVAFLKNTIADNESRFRLTMGRYVTAEVMEQLLSSSDATIAGERRKVTMMFRDIMQHAIDRYNIVAL